MQSHNSVLLAAGSRIAEELARATPPIAACLFGSVGIYVKHPNLLPVAISLARPNLYDLDVVATPNAKRLVIQLLERLGYHQRPELAGLRALQRPALYAASGQYFVEVFTAPLELHHTIHCTHRLVRPDGVLALGDLLLSKLQYEHLRQERLADLAGLLIMLGRAESTQRDEAIRIISAATGATWGFTATVRRNLAEMRRYAQTNAHALDKVAFRDISQAIRLIRIAIEKATKSVSWYLEGCARRLPVVKSIPIGMEVDDEREEVFERAGII